MEKIWGPRMTMARTAGHPPEMRFFSSAGRLAELSQLRLAGSAGVFGNLELPELSGRLQQASHSCFSFPNLSKTPQHV